MKTERGIVGIVAVAAAILGSACAAEQTAAPKVAQTPAAPAAGEKPGIVVAELVEFRAKVDAVDYGKRLVTLTGPQGNTVVVKAGPEIRNLDQVKPGDQLVVKHYESVALFVRKSAEPPQVAEMAAVAVAAPGQKPEGVMVDTAELTAKVTAIDYAKRTVTLRGPEGRTRTIKVDPAVKRFQEIKAGDEVVVRHTEALAISVQRP